MNVNRTTDRLFAVLENGDLTRVTDGIERDWHGAIDAWYHHDRERRMGNRPHVRYYAVRAANDPEWANAVIDPAAFECDHPTATLTDREYAEVIGSLQIIRDKARAQGREPKDVVSALAKLTADCTPSTNGLSFSLVQS